MAAQEYYQSFQQRPQAPPYPSASFPGPQSYGSPYQQPSNSSSSQHLKPSGPHYATPPTLTPQPKPQPQLQPQRKDYLAPVPYQQQPSRPSAGQHLNLPSLAPTRSHSEPPESRRLELEPHRHHHHHSHHHSRDHSRSRSRSDRSRSRSRSHGYDHDHDHDRARSRSRNRSHSRHTHSHHSHHSRSRARSTRDTFLGAGGGAIVGDAIFPGLGTLGGALLGGWGGHEYAKKRSKSDSRTGEGGRRDGITVRNGWVER